MQNTALSHETCPSVRMQNAALSHETRTSVRMQNAALSHETHTSVRMQLLRSQDTYKHVNAERSSISCLTHVCSVSVPAGDDSDDGLRELQISEYNKDQICLSGSTIIHDGALSSHKNTGSHDDDYEKLALCTQDIC